MKKTILTLFLLFLLTAKSSGEEITALTFDQAQAKISADIKTLSIYRERLAFHNAFIANNPDIFPDKNLKPGPLLSQPARESIRRFWQSTMDYYLALDSLGKFYHHYYKIEDEELKELSFLIFYEAFVLQYRSALDLIVALDKIPGIDVILNEPMPELGLPKDTYNQFKFRFLNVGRGMEFAALDTYYHTRKIAKYTGSQDFIRTDAQRLWQMGKGYGEKMTLKNGLKIIKGAGFAAYFPIQAGISEWMGDVKIKRRHESLISAHQIQSLTDVLEPGDILLERREWYLSNIGLPGFWTHAALYIGTPAQRQQFFSDNETSAWIKKHGQADGSFENLLSTRYNQAYQLSIKPLENGHASRILEAIGEGVSFTSIEHSADCDSLVVLRPRLSKKEKAQAILKGFYYSGRPYDFNFDFLTDSELVCTELIYKAYEAGPEQQGLKLSLIEYLGHLLIPANDVAMQFSEQYGTQSQQMDMIVFLDGYEKSKQAKNAALSEFRQSWKRPKWHVLTQ